MPPKVSAGAERTPQNQKMGPDYDYDAPNSVHKLNYLKFPDFTPNFNHIILNNGVKLTDNISSSPIPFFVKIVSRKLLNILLTFKLPPHQIYEVPVIYNGEKIPRYYGLHLLIDKKINEAIDYSQSKFWYKDDIKQTKIKFLPIKTATELDNMQQESVEYYRLHGESRPPIWAEDLVMQEDFYETADLYNFYLITYPPYFYVTEKLKSAVEKEKCTGINFKCVSNTREEIRDYWGKDTYTFFP